MIKLFLTYILAYSMIAFGFLFFAFTLLMVDAIHIPTFFLNMVGGVVIIGLLKKLRRNSEKRG